LEHYPKGGTSNLLRFGNRAVNPNGTRQRRLQTNQITQQRRLAATAAAQDHKNITALHLEVGVLLQDHVAPAHRQVDDFDERRRHRPAAWKAIVKMASSTTRTNRIVTTADVVRRPTPSAPP